jgi:hypothetical protein
VWTRINHDVLWMRVACCLVILEEVAACSWDVLNWIKSDGSESFCEATRFLNVQSGGLLAMLYFVFGIHLFFSPWLPSWWQVR